MITHNEWFKFFNRIDMVRGTFNLVKPYFQYDWLMPRAFIAICPFKQLIHYVENNPEVSFFACWILGYKLLEEINLDDQVYILYIYIYTHIYINTHTHTLQ